jgi:type IV secretion system protein VirB11
LARFARPSCLAPLIENFEVGRTLEMEPINHVLYTTFGVVLYMRAWRVLQVFYDPIFKRAQMS